MNLSPLQVYESNRVIARSVQRDLAALGIYSFAEDGHIVMDTDQGRKLIGLINALRKQAHSQTPTSIV